MSRYNLSIIYLLAGTLAVVGFIAFLNRWSQPFISLFILAIPFYLATLTLVIFVHPIICAVILAKKLKINVDYKPVLIHLVWLLAIATTFGGMILNGYVITA